MPKSSEKKSSQSKQKQKLTSIRATPAKIGIKNPLLAGILLAEVDKRVADARQHADAHIAKAQSRAERIMAKAEESALKQILKPIHVCHVLARTTATAMQAQTLAEHPAKAQEKKPKLVREETSS